MQIPFFMGFMWYGGLVSRRGAETQSFFLFPFSFLLFPFSFFLSPFSSLLIPVPFNFPGSIHRYCQHQGQSETTEQ